MKNFNLKTVMAIAAVVLVLLLVLSSYGVFDNDVSEAGRIAPFYWKLIALLPLSALVYLIHKAINSDIEVRGQFYALLVFLFALYIAANCAFFFPAGDKKQYKTCFNLDGKIEDPEGCLFKDYGEFYKFDKDTALRNYVLKYKELPGVNNWAYNIRFGKTPPSTAPRANEDFEWHTGAYEK